MSNPDPWHLFVKHFRHGKSITLDILEDIEVVSVKQVMSLIEAKIGLPQDEQRLVFGGKQLDKEKKLCDYKCVGIGANATLHLVLKLNGGSSFTSLEEFKERDTPQGPDLKYSDDVPCMICATHPNEDDQYNAKRLPLVMPCPKGHTMMHPHCLIQFCQNEIFDNRKGAVCCPQCQYEWSPIVIEKYGVTTKEEQEAFLEGLSYNFIYNDPDISECPGCSSFCERKNKADIRMHCRICAKQGKNSDFCWHCKQPWSGGGSKDCSNPMCDASGILAQINAAPEKEVVGVLCPSIRLCPDCGAPIEHNQHCKQMTCKACQSEFCFICLRQRRDGCWQCGGCYDKCTPAPRQVKVPSMQ